MCFQGSFRGESPVIQSYSDIWDALGIYTTRAVLHLMVCGSDSDVMFWPVCLTCSMDIFVTALISVAKLWSKTWGRNGNLASWVLLLDIPRYYSAVVSCTLKMVTVLNFLISPGFSVCFRRILCRTESGAWKYVFLRWKVLKFSLKKIKEIVLSVLKLMYSLYNVFHTSLVWNRLVQFKVQAN